MNEALARYLADFDSVEGWLSPTTARMLAFLVERLTARGITGPVVEIGIHHGKSFLPLAMSAAPGDRLVAIDCFELPGANVDGSGMGDKRALEANLARFAPGRDVDILSIDSLTLGPRIPEMGLGGTKFFSIDGGHTREHTCNDLLVADECLRDEGIVVLDDLLNGYWLGVVTGYFDFVARRDTLVPVAMVPNKLVLTRPDKAAEYRAEFRAEFEPALVKEGTQLGDWPVDFYGFLPE